MNSITEITVRVYGLLINNQNEILISNEKIDDIPFTKFPGGGLQLGEGLADALKREFLEELDIEILPAGLFYVTDFFVENYFKPKQQVIAIYYFVKAVSPESVKEINLKQKELESLNKRNLISHKWVKQESVLPSLFSFPAEQKAAEHFQKRINKEVQIG